LVERLEHFGRVAHQAGFSHLELEPMRRKAGAREHCLDDVGQFRLLELQRGDVHRNRRRLAAASDRPAAGLAAGLSERPLADPEDQAGLFGNVDEAAGQQFAALGIVPAQQRFHSGNGSAGDGELRLVDQRKLVLRKRRAQPRLQAQPGVDALVHRRRVEVVAVAAVSLGEVHRRIGTLDQRLLVFAVVRIHADPDAGRDMQLRLVHRQRLADRLQDRLGDMRGRGRLGIIGSTTMNSSPPRRPTVSVSRTRRVIRFAISAAAHRPRHARACC
jgi:hypothetical protein